MKINKVLIANRGEIACRIIKTLNRLGIESVAVYSEADRHAKHVSMAHEAYLLGPAPSPQSYLVIDKIIEIAKSSGSDAIHPGYGFLSENAAFARRLKEEGIILIGPSAEAMEIMGNKLSAKEAVLTYDIPMVPGVDHAVSDPEEAKKIADSIGYPVLIKAAAGGGGKGMRVVDEPAQIKEQIALAVSEATSAFGDGSVFIEKYVTRPRHIEIQILGDHHGNYVHLFERECSIQRRHQKVVEEAPSVVLTDELRHAMGAAAIDVARSCKYTGVGTVEFLLDSSLDFFFLEMNTRLQVEHPITEMITGLDLVEQQIHVAEGKVLDLKQEDIQMNGHSIELRVYAEDPYDNFMPSINTLSRYEEPSGAGIRVDSGFSEGMEIPIYYDPMISKLVVHGATRGQAIQRMKEAIQGYKIGGIETTLQFGAYVMNHPNFVSGDFDTHFVKNYWSEAEFAEQHEDLATAVACLLKHLEEQKSKQVVIPNS